LSPPAPSREIAAATESEKYNQIDDRIFTGGNEGKKDGRHLEEEPPNEVADRPGASPGGIDRDFPLAHSTLNTGGGDALGESIRKYSPVNIRLKRKPRVKKAKSAAVINLADYSPVINRPTNSGELTTGENSPQGIFTGGNSAKRRGRPRGRDQAKPFAPEYYEWREDSGGWKLVHRPPKGKNRRGYAYIGFLNQKRWEYFRRFDDAKFIKFVTQYFEQRRGQGGSFRAG
jgi:hypothetical protein